VQFVPACVHAPRLRPEADRLACEAWNQRVLDYKGRPNARLRPVTLSTQTIAIWWSIAYAAIRTKPSRYTSCDVRNRHRSTNRNAACAARIVANHTILTYGLGALQRRAVPLLKLPTAVAVPPRAVCRKTAEFTFSPRRLSATHVALRDPPCELCVGPHDAARGVCAVPDAALCRSSGLQVRRAARPVAGPRHLILVPWWAPRGRKRPLPEVRGVLFDA
jgi:hypothetical protein